MNAVSSDGAMRREALQPGDRVRLISPASTPSSAEVQYATRVLHGLGLQVECGQHLFDAVGYMAGTDEDRLQDLNDALRDPGIAAVVEPAVIGWPILLLEAFGMRLGHIDRQLTMLTNAGLLRHLVAVAVGQYMDCGADATTQGDWTAVDVLRDRLHRLGVPVLGGHPIGHGRPATAVPVGTMSTLDADAGTLTVASAVR